MSETSAFKVGDIVEWTSQSAGRVKRKIGQVAQVVPPRGEPEGVYNPGSCRSHESYVVAVWSRRYWPRVSLLRKPTADGRPPLPLGYALPCRACGNLWDSWADFLGHRNADGTCKPWPLSRSESPDPAAGTLNATAPTADEARSEP